MSDETSNDLIQLTMTKDEASIVVSLVTLSLAVIAKKADHAGLMIMLFKAEMHIRPEFKNDIKSALDKIKQVAKAAIPDDMDQGLKDILNDL